VRAYIQQDAIFSNQKKGITSMADTQDKELAERETALIAEIERLLPDFARSCRGSQDVVIIHQDSFAADYQDEEYTLFGKAIKFAGVSTEKKSVSSGRTERRSLRRRPRSYNKVLPQTTAARERIVATKPLLGRL
jgi:hypothetical protein